ncbi:MAG: DUF5011 domain-containing protein, partial [Candidatus Marinimicrobia bacterium]|nr:DUF5011 domain-containing protein [Candidatus Neomarinimicrobiota bacterium]
GSVDVNLDGSASSDADGDALTYSWVLNGAEINTSAGFTANLSGGTHTYTLTVSDAFDSSSDDIIVTVIEDSEPPVLTLLGDNPLDLGLYLEYIEAGAEAVDVCDPNVTVVVTGAVDINIPGEYTVTYTATDAGGNSRTEDRVITVFNTAPEVVNAVTGVELSFGNAELSLDIDLSTVFGDIDVNDVLSYSFSNSNDDAATAVLAGSVLTLDAVDLGESVVEITATDPWGETATQSFTVVVNVNVDLAESLLFGYSEVKIKQDVEINSGNLIVNESFNSESEDDGDNENDGDDDSDDDGDGDGDDDSENDHEWKYELKVDKDTYIAPGYFLMADHIQIKKDAEIESDVYANTLDNRGDISGEIFGDVITPVFSTLPPFKSAPAGSQNITVNKNQSLVLEPGDYGRIKVKERGTLTFTGGVYNIEKLEAKKSSHIRFEAVTEVRIEEELKISKKSYVGPAGGSFIDASDIIFYIAGDEDHAAKLEEEVEFYGTIYALYGEVELKEKVTFTGALLSNKIEVDEKCVLTVDSYFAGAAVGLAKGGRVAWVEPEMEPELPVVSNLAGNYPNPFNPSTTIDFALDKAGDISLKIYDIREAEVAEVAHGYYAAGNYSVHFTPENMSSGTYLYVLKAGSFREVNRMVYLK